jgi:hypothetical protein
MIAALVLVAALLLVPGIGAALALAPPGAARIETRIALAFGLGYTVVAGVAIVLVVARIFTLPTFVVGLVLVTAGVWVAALRRASLGAHAAALRAQARDGPIVLAGGLAFLVAVGVTRALFPADTSLAIRSAWRYWADGLEVAAAGHVPAHTGQWGTQIEPTTSKVVLNAFEGGVSFLLGPEPLPAMHAILVVAAIGLAAALLALGREAGLRLLAPLVPALVILAPSRVPLSQEMSSDLRWYTAEDVGRMVAFAGLVAGVYALRTRAGRLPFVATGLVLVAAGLTHLVPTVMAALLLTFFALAAVVVARMELRRALVGGAIVVVVFLVAYVAVIGLSGGDLGFQRATGSKFQGVPANVDATRSFSRGSYAPLTHKEGHFLIPPKTLLLHYGEVTVNGRRGRDGLIGLVLLGVAGLVAAWFVRTLFPAVAMAIGLGAAIYVAALFFSFRYDTRVPGDFGSRRLYDYIAVVTGLLIPAVLEAGTRLVMPRIRWGAAALASAAAVVAVAAAAYSVPADRSLQRAAAGEAVIARVAETVPCGARMLVNARTAGTWEATTGRHPLTEGHAPYLRPDVMEKALRVLIGANTFFDDPAAHRDFLTRERVQYLVVVKPQIWVGTAGQRRPALGEGGGRPPGRPAGLQRSQGHDLRGRRGGGGARRRAAEPLSAGFLSRNAGSKPRTLISSRAAGDRGAWYQPM